MGDEGKGRVDFCYIVRYNCAFRVDLAVIPYMLKTRKLYYTRYHAAFFMRYGSLIGNGVVLDAVTLKIETVASFGVDYARIYIYLSAPILFYQLTVP